MKYLSLDVGEKRIGVAVSDDLGITVSPVGVLQVSENLLNDFAKIISEERPSTVVFGIPRHQNGDLAESAVKIQAFAKIVEHEYGVVVDFEDESVTSIEAEKRLVKKGKNSKEIKEQIDAESACIILESYLARKS